MADRPIRAGGDAATEGALAALVGSELAGGVVVRQPERCLPPDAPPLPAKSLRKSIRIAASGPRRESFVTSELEDELSDGLGDQGTDGVGELLLLMDEPTGAPRTATGEPEPVRE
jgi:hypothetical protein